MAIGLWQLLGVVIPPVASDSPEQPTVLPNEGNAKILSGTVFKMWFTTGAASSPVGINYAESTDGITWTRYVSNPVLAQAWGARVFKHPTNGTLYMYVTKSATGISGATAIAVYTSPVTDGLNWTLQNANAVTAAQVSAWATGGLVGQMNIAGIDGNGVWYGYFWGLVGSLGGTASYPVGLATSTDGINWTVVSTSAPIIADNTGAFCFQTVSGTTYGWSQTTPTGGPTQNGIPTDITRYSAPSLAGPWTPLGQYTLFRTTANEGVGTAKGQLADPSIVSDGTNLWAYYTAVADGSTGTGYQIKAAKIPNFTFAQLVQTYEGIPNIPTPWPNRTPINFTNLASESFTGPNANPIGGNWTPLGGTPTAGWAFAQRLSNKFTSTAGTTSCDSFFNALAWNADQWASVTVSTMLSSSFIGVSLRESAVAKTAQRFYWNGNTGSSGTWTVQFVNNGSFEGSPPTGTVTINVGDIFTGAFVGTQRSLYLNGALLHTSSSATITSGSAGALVNPTSVATNAGLTAFSAGGITNPSAPGGGAGGQLDVLWMSRPWVSRIQQ